MPFQKHIRKGKTYFTHKGKVYTPKQVKFYYASKGTWRRRRRR